MDIPKLRILKRHVEALKRADFNRLTFNEVYRYIEKTISFIPFTVARIHANHHVERARINFNGEIFNKEELISYIKDPSIIKGYGRANKPSQSMFYGAVKSDLVPLPRIVNCAEIHDVLRTKNKNNITTDFIVTVGKWRIINDIDVIEMVFKDDLINNVPDIERAYKQQMSHFEKKIPHGINQMKYLLSFFSDEFAKSNIESDRDYWISAAYTNMALKFKGINGIMYPSVRTEYLGTNVALTPEAVDKNLRLEKVEMFKVFVKGHKVFLDTLMETTDLGIMNSDFKWIKKNGVPAKVIEQYFNE